MSQVGVELLLMSSDDQTVRLLMITLNEGFKVQSFDSRNFQIFSRLVSDNSNDSMGNFADNAA